MARTASSSRAADAAAWVDPEAVLSVASLALRARIVVEGFQSGLHRSPYHGFSAEFREYRPYVPGDDLRYLDWKLFARTDRRYLKRFEDETNLRCHLLVDLSRSMAFGHGRRTKAEYAVTLAATLARFFLAQRDAVGVLTFDGSLRDHVPARHRPGQFERVCAVLARGTAGHSTGLSTALARAAVLVKRRGLCILVSDFLAPPDELDAALGQLAARGHEILAFRVLDPAELALSFDAPSLFEDLETGRTLYVDPEAARAGYRRRFDAHARDLAAVFARNGVELVDWRTDRPLAQVLVELLQARLRRRHVRRRAAATGGNG